MWFASASNHLLYLVCTLNRNSLMDTLKVLAPGGASAQSPDLCLLHPPCASPAGLSLNSCSCSTIGKPLDKQGFPQDLPQCKIWKETLKAGDLPLRVSLWCLPGKCNLFLITGLNFILSFPNKYSSDYYIKTSTLS